MECSLSFFHCDGKSLSEDLLTAVVGQLEVVHARHHAGKVVVGSVRRLARTAHNGKDWRKTLEACIKLAIIHKKKSKTAYRQSEA